MTTAGTATAVNPYPGPRSFTTGETLYGRDGEVARLLDILIAERIVLLCSPSGAGKTSLIQAGLIPVLSEEGFHVLPVVRVGLQLGLGDDANRYRTCSITSLQAGLPADQQLATSDMGITLGDYLSQRGGDERDEVLVFDQFEELLTLDSTDVAAKQEFLADVGEALRDRHRWALFVMREEYIAGLDPYLRLLPTRLRARFRLDLLDEHAARLAMQAPAESNGVAFSPDAATRLIDDLRRVRVQRPGDAGAIEPGPHIEPVQLQVVCRQLWSRLPDGARQIGEAAVEAMGDVSLALADYYEERVQAAVRTRGVRERAVRDWFEKRLIIGQGFRNQVLELPEGDGGEEVAQDLEDDHLIRADWRRGARWYELAHDRLIDPVKASNGAWREKNLTALQRQAGLWNDEGRIDGLLLTGEALDRAESWLVEHAGELDATEQEFVDACRRARGDAERERRAARRTRRFLVALAVLTLLAIAASVIALVWYGNARRQARTAKSRELAAAAESVVNIDPSLAILLAREAVGDAGNPLLDLRAALYRAVYSSDVLMTLPTATDLAFSPRDGGQMITGSADGGLQLWDAESGTLIHTLVRPAPSGPADPPPMRVNAVAFSTDGRVASGNKDGTAKVWEAESGRLIHTLVRPAPSGPADPPQMPVNAVAFSPDGTMLATGNDDGTAALWDTANTSSGRLLGELPAHKGSMTGLAFTPDGAQLVTVGADGLAMVWQVATLSPLQELAGNQGKIHAVTISPDGTLLATAGHDKTVRLWDLASGTEVRALSGHRLAVLHVAFSADGRWLATAGEDNEAKLWNVESGAETKTLGPRGGPVRSVAFDPRRPRLAVATETGKVSVWNLTEGHAQLIIGVAVRPDGNQVATASRDGTTKLWNAGSGEVEQTLEGDSGGVSAVAYAPTDEGRVLASAGQDGTVRTWDSTNGQALGTFAVGSKAVNDVAFAPDGRRLATAGADGTVRVWDTQSGALLLTPKETGNSVNAVAFSADGQQLAGASANIVQVWNTSNWAEGPQLNGHKGEVNDVTFGPDGRLATASADTTVKVWETGSHREVRSFARHTETVWAVAFSPEGERVASASKDRTVRVFDVGSGTESLRISTPLEMYGVAFAADSTVAAVGQTRRLYLYTLDLEELIRLARQRSLRNLTPVECDQYLNQKDC